MSHKKTTEQFIAEARAKHGNKYDYSRTNYINAKVKVEIICPEHGSFFQVPDTHLRPCGCNSCVGEAVRKGRGFDKITFSPERAKEAHGDKYDYSKVIYTSAKNKVEIICPEHGSFFQTPEKHYGGCGCPKCGAVIGADKRRCTNESFIPKAREKHGNKYDYSHVEYVGNDTPVKIVCPDHGAFWQRPGNHLLGKGCKACADILTGNARRSSGDEWVEKARATHGDKYDYSKVEYFLGTDRVTIICPEHGEFKQIAQNHVNGATGCPDCANSYGPSKAECEIFEHVKRLCPDAEQSVIGLLEGKHELDIVIPSLKVAIEFNGLIWHSEKFNKDRMYHQRKTDQAALSGYRLIHIWQDEWAKQRPWVEAFLNRLCGVPTRKVYARKCFLGSVPTSQARLFLDANHLQGYRQGEHLGMYHEGEVVAVATHGINRMGENELIRWCVKLGVSVVGGFSRVMKRLPADIISFCDTAKHDASGYLAAGWKIESETVPMYHYTDGKTRFNRQRFQKHKLLQMPGVSGTTEREMANSLGFYQIGGLKQLKLTRA